ncbi:MAG: sulfatase-like hydrolase/transferase [Acidobacteriota bacterium]
MSPRGSSLEHAALLAVVAGLATVARGTDAASTPPNVVLVTIDTLRADHVGAYGGRYKTPTLDAIAAAGVRFERAYTTAPITVVAHSSLMTGLYPFHHGVRANGFYSLPAEQTTLAEVLRRAGYATAAFVSGFPLDARFGLAQGFDTYDDRFTHVDASGSAYDAERPAAETIEKALAFLTKPPPRFFLWVHLYDPHAEYRPPEPYRTRFASSPYDGEIAYADAELGKLWKRLEPDLARTLVVVAGDHGESLGEHGEATHTIFVYDATVRVPLLVAGPGVVPRRVGKTAVSLVDIYGTVVARAHAGDSTSDGRSLEAAFDGSGDDGIPDRVLYFESYAPRLEFGWSQLLGVRRDNLKLVQSPEAQDVELYDTSADPAESRDIAAARPRDRDDLLARLRALQGGDGVGAQSPGAPLDPAAVEKLRSLGYLEGGATLGTLGSHGPLAAPRRMIASQPRIDDALRLMSRGKPKEAAAELAEVMALDPHNPFVAQARAGAQYQQGDSDGALATLRAVAPTAPPLTRSALLASAGDILRRAGRIAESEKELRAALDLDARNVKAMETLALTLLAGGKLEAAESMLGNALRIDPGDARALATRAEVLLAKGRFADARDDFAAAMARDPGLGGMCLFGLARVAIALEDPQAAIVEPLRSMETAVGVDADLLHRAGTLAAEQGALDLAIALLSRAASMAPGTPSLLQDLGVALSRAGRTDEAIAKLSAAKDLAPRDAGIWNALGTAQARAGRFADAVRSFEEALRIDPKSESARQNLEAARAALAQR